MAKMDLKKNWWVVMVVVGIVAIGAWLIIDKWIPDYEYLGMVIPCLLIGGSFCWVYGINKEENWWAIIPGLALFTIVVVGLTDVFLIGTDSANDWIDVTLLGVGTSIIALVLKRKNAKRVLIIVSMFVFLVAFLMSPAGTTWKIILILVDIAVAAYCAYRTYDK